MLFSCRPSLVIAVVMLATAAVVPCNGAPQTSTDMNFKPFRIKTGVWGFDTGSASGPWGIKDQDGNYQVDPVFDRVAIFINGYAPVKKYGQWGFIDTQAQIALPCKFDGIWQPEISFPRITVTVEGESPEEYLEIDTYADWSAGFAPGVFPVKAGEKWGVIAASGSWIVQADLDQIVPVQENRAKIRRNDKYGFLDQNGVMVIEPVYDEIEPFTEGFAACSINGLWGYIDPSGIFLIQPKFDYAFPFIHGSALVQKGSMCGVLDTNGIWKLPPTYDSIVRNFSGDLFRTMRNGVYGLYSPIEGELIPPSISYMWAEPHDLIKIRQGTRHGLLNASGATVIPCNYEEIEVDKSNLVRLYQDGLWGFYDLRRKKLIAPQYSKLEPFYDGIAAVNCQGRWGYIDATGELIIPAQYVWVSDFVKGAAAVLNASACVVIDREGQVIEKPEIYYQSPALPDGSRYVLFNNKYGFFGKDGTFTIAPHLDSAKWFVDTGVILAEEGNFWSLIIPGNAEVSALRFKSVGDVSENMCWVKTIDNKVGFIDKNGQLVIPPVYKQARGFRKGWAAVRKDQKWGFINSKGEEIVPFEYDDLDYLEMDSQLQLQVIRNGVKGVLDITGKFCPFEAPTTAGNLQDAFPNAEDPLQRWPTR